MPCPLFLPTHPLAASSPVAAPLGNLYDGTCAAAPAAEPSAEIDGRILRRCCNSGYARAECARANTTEADAARFLLRSDQDGVIQVAWAAERDHHPFAVGVMPYSPHFATSDQPLERQIAAFVASYLRQSAGQGHP